MTNMTIQQALDTAVKFHQAGRLKDAEPLYRKILDQMPNQPDALHMLGVLAHQVGRIEMAGELINRAIGINPHAPAYHSNMGLVLVSMNRKDQAVKAYQRALELRPNYPEANNNLGIVLFQLGFVDEAINNYRRAIDLRPDYFDAHHNLGDALTSKRLPLEAIECYKRALAGKPDWPDASNNLGNAYFATGQFDLAIESYRKAIALAPHFPGAYTNMGNAFAAKGLFKEAIEFHRKAVGLEPNAAEAHFNLGNALQSTGRPAEAIECFERAIELRPDHSDFYGNLGGALYFTGKIEQAIPAFRKAVELKPEFDQAHYNLANAYYGKGMSQEAINSFRQAIAFTPNWAMALNNLGNALKDVSMLDEALLCYDRASELEPENPYSHRNRVYALLFHPGYDAATILDEHKKWNQQHAQPLNQFIQPHENDRDPNRRLRIGYVSPDFREHVVGQNLLPLLQNHDHHKFEIFCYPCVTNTDAVTGQFRAVADHWQSIAGATDEEAAKLIRNDKIDILVDLALHMAGNRLPLYAYKPAPIQVTFGGYPGGTGLEAMDYRLSDPHLDPPEFENHYVETTVRLPDSFWCYDPVAMGVAEEPKVSELPAKQNGYITFGCLNNFTKVNDPTLRLWAQVLTAVPNSRLILLAPRGDAQRRTLSTLAKGGIDKSRVQFVDRQGRQGYFRNYHRIDIGLDTLPYNGHTTSLDSLWMGVPVITLLGQTVVGRAGWSQVCNLNLRELAATTPEEFVETAAALANDLPRLTKLREGLRGRMLDSALTDPKRFARGIEAAFRQMWQQWCAKA